MNSETEIIKAILGNFRKSSHHKNDFFQSDSEIIRIGCKDYLISIDTYSDEDHFRLSDPYILGMNLATCTLSDIFACGGKPIIYMNSINCEHSWDLNYIDSLSKGISSVLQKCGAPFAGGDFGYCRSWNYTGVVIGQSDRIITRKGASSGDLIYVTGQIGRGNFEAASVLCNKGIKEDDLFKKHPVIFPIRIQESALISKFASSCIDTSDGLFRSLQIISDINNCGFIVSSVPFYSPGTQWTESVGLPEECLIFGECGEYELLFTVSPSDEKNLLKNASETGIRLYRIGRITENCSRILYNNKYKFILNDFNIYARDFYDHYQYIALLTKYLLSIRTE